MRTGLHAPSVLGKKGIVKQEDNPGMMAKLLRWYDISRMRLLNIARVFVLNAEKTFHWQISYGYSRMKLTI